MKNTFVQSLAASFLFIFASSAAFSADPVITLSRYSGYVMPDYARSLQCEVYANRVVISRRLGAGQDGSVATVEERPITLSGDLSKLIVAAQGEVIRKTDNNLCDGPGGSVTASLGGTDESSQVLLYTTGGCGSPTQERTGGKSRILRDLVESYCGSSGPSQHP